jgi:uncharacterized protein YneF (UPF0154 family)
MGIALSLGALAGMLICLEIGYRLARKQLTETSQDGVGAMEAAVFALLGLLLAFSFSGGTSRLETRRQLIIEEANAIGTAYLRVDLLAAEEQPEMRRLFKEYLDARMAVYQQLPDLAAAERQIALAEGIQARLWTKAVAASRASGTPVIAQLLLPALNQMFDVTTARRVVLYTHLPALILVLLLSVAMLSGLLAGYAMAKRGARSWLHMLAYAGAVSVTIYAIIDLDYPRTGWIRLDAADSALVKLRDSIR